METSETIIRLQNIMTSYHLWDLKLSEAIKLLNEITKERVKQINDKLPIWKKQ